MQAVVAVDEVLHDHATQLGTHDGSELFGVLGTGAGFGQSFGNRAHIADRDRLLQQVLQSTGQDAQRQFARDQVFHDLGGLGRELVEQLLGFVVSE